MDPHIIFDLPFVHHLCDYLLCALCQPAAAFAAAQLVSAADPRSPVAATAGGISGSASMTPDQRYVVFVSDAANLTTNRHGAVLDVFLRDRLLARTRLISAGLDGSSGGDGDSQAPSMSTNGQWVAFHSDATNLTNGDTNNATDVFLRDVTSGVTRLISVSPDGTPCDGPSTYPILSADGRRVAFESLASNLTHHDTNQAPDVFVADIASGKTILVSVNAAGDTTGNGASTVVDMTPDGRYVLFTSTSSNLVSGMTNRGREVFVRDLTAGVTVWASTNAAHLLSGGLIPAESRNPSLDASGRHVAFEIYNRNSVLVAYHDLESGVTQVISSNNLPMYLPGGGTSPGWNYSPDWAKPRLSADGRWVAFVSPLLRGTNYVNQVYVWDAETSSTTLASANTINGEAANASSDRPVLSAAGRTLAFVSVATDMTSAPADGSPQVYVRDLVHGLTSLASTNRFGAPSDAGDPGAMDLSPDGSGLLFESIDPQHGRRRPEPRSGCLPARPAHRGIGPDLGAGSGAAVSDRQRVQHHGPEWRQCGRPICGLHQPRR